MTHNLIQLQHTPRGFLDKLKVHLVILLEYFYNSINILSIQDLALMKISRIQSCIDSDIWKFNSYQVVSKKQLVTYLKNGKLAHYRWYVVRENSHKWWIYDSEKKSWQILHNDEQLNIFIGFSRIAKNRNHSVCFVVTHFLDTTRLPNQYSFYTITHTLTASYPKS